MRRTLWTFALLLAATLTAGTASAQLTIECLQPAEPGAQAGGDCQMTVSRNPAREVIVVQVKAGGVPARDVNVTFTAPEGGLDPAVSKTDERGEASARWTGSVGSTPIIVTARAEQNGAAAARRIAMAAPAPATKFELAYVDGDSQSWYEKRQLKDTLVVEIEGARGDTCLDAKVAFRPIGTGSTSPDTVRGQWNATERRCTVSTRWRLQEGVGVQHMRAELSGAAPVMFHAYARALPRITLGLALSNPSGYPRLERASDTVTVTRNFGDSTVVRKQVTSRDTLKSENPDWPITPVIGFDWPLVPQARWLRVSAAASLAAPTTDWFVGFSLLQLKFSLPHEANGVTLNLVAHLSRREEVMDAQACRFRRECETDDKVRFVSGGAMFTIAQADLFSTLTTLFRIK